jgi:hypothetical protein
LGIDRIFKKINFKLQEKGMTFSDWLNCLPYDDDFDLDSLVHVGEKIGLQLDRE